MRTKERNSTLQDMPNAIEMARFEPPPAALIEALASDPNSAGAPAARMRNQQERARAALKRQSDNFDALYDEVARSEADAAYLEQMAEIVLQNENATGERLRPDIVRLQKKLSAHPPKLAADMRDHLQESLDIAVAWLELYKTLRARLLGLASERKSAPRRVLRARPVKGDINYADLSREHVARYPKIRAALAK